MRGSCLCGGVEFDVGEKVTPIQFCHAARCQKATGGAFAPEMAAPRESLRWIRGEDLISHYEAPLLEEPPPYRRAFCRVCGSPLPVEQTGTDFVVILAGVLDSDPGTRPFRQIFLSQRAAWFAPPSEPRSFENRPPPESRLPTREDFK